MCKKINVYKDVEKMKPSYIASRETLYYVWKSWYHLEINLADPQKVKYRLII